MKRLLLLFLPLLIITACCKEEDDICDDPTNPMCDNYDPCYTSRSANAGFIVFDSLGTPGTGYVVGEVDTTWSSNDIFFRANHESDYYEWQVGTDPTIYNTRSFELYFGNIEGDISVRLITAMTDEEGCLEESERRDTVIKTFHLVDLGQGTLDGTIPIFGDFTGYDEHAPNDIYTITIANNFHPMWNSGLHFFPNNTEYCDPYDYGGLSCFYGYREFLIGENALLNCDNAKGRGVVQSDNKTIVIDYTTLKEDGTRTQPKRFVGVKE